MGRRAGFSIHVRICRWSKTAMPRVFARMAGIWSDLRSFTTNRGRPLSLLHARYRRASKPKRLQRAQTRIGFRQSEAPSLFTRATGNCGLLVCAHCQLDFRDSRTFDQPAIAKCASEDMDFACRGWWVHLANGALHRCRRREENQTKATSYRRLDLVCLHARCAMGDQRIARHLLQGCRCDRLSLGRSFAFHFGFH